jgi:hypothetical protein
MTKSNRPIAALVVARARACGRRGRAVGQTFMRLEQRMGELKKSFGLEDKDLNLDLGPLGKLM